MKKTRDKCLWATCIKESWPKDCLTQGIRYLCGETSILWQVWTDAILQN